MISLQNYLRESNIVKIIDTYRGWKTDDKFSYAATMDEIRENEFNLNIPRYVDTFEPEPPVDLKVVAKELAELEKQMKATDKTISKFCKELGIPSPVGGSLQNRRLRRYIPKPRVAV